MENCVILFPLIQMQNSTMQDLPISRQEEGRLSVLNSYDILDTPSDPDFDNLARLAADICKTQMATIGFLDAQRIWFKSHIGLLISETPRDNGFCRYTVLKDDFFEVTQPLADNRFDKNILVEGETSVRYYAGIPLINKEGYRIGALAVMGPYPHKLDERQKQAMRIIRAAVMSLLELRREERDAKFFKDALVESAQVAILDDKDRFEYINSTFAALAELKESELLGKSKDNIKLGDFTNEQKTEIAERTAEKKPWKGKIRNISLNGTVTWSKATIMPFLGKSGNLIKTLYVRNDITNEVALKEQLEETEHISRSGSWELNLLNGLSTWSQGMYKIFDFDYQYEKAPDQSFLNFIIPLDYYKVNALFKRLTGNELAGPVADYKIINKKGKDLSSQKLEMADPVVAGKTQAHPLEFKILTRKAVEKDVKGIVKTRLNNKGEVIGLYGSLTEVRDAKDFKIPLETKLNGVHHAPNDKVPYGYWVTNAFGQFHEANETILNWLGYTSEELIDLVRVHDLLVTHDDVKLFEENIRLLEAREHPKEVQLTLKKKDGGILNVLFNVSSLRHDHGNTGGYAAYIFDISALKRQLAAVEESETMYRNLIEESAQMMFTADMQGRFTFVSNRLKKILGYSDKDLLGKQFASIYDGEYRKKSIAFYQKQLLDKTEETEYIAPIIIKSGEKLWIEQVGTLIKKNNNIVGYRFALHDITHRLKTQEAMEEAARLATEAKDMQQTFLGKMSHEIRTPMNGVVGMLNLLTTTTLSEEQREFVDGIKESSRNMIRIINDILDFTKIESGKLIFEETEFVLKNLVNSVVFNLKAGADERGIQLISNIDSQIPDVLIADPVRLNQILLNLGDNALKFTEKGSITINVIQKAMSPDTVTLEFSVADTGIGIPQAKLNTIFESFTQAQSDTTRKYGGTGLGLTIAKQLIEQQGGFIKVTSLEGQGTTFTFTFHFKLNKAAIITEKAKVTPSNTITSFEGYDILLVEDNIMNQRVAKYTIEKWGAKLTVADSGAKALELLRENKYDLILMDIQMPDMNGIQTTDKIRNELHCKTPIMAMTASVMQGEKDNCIKVGMSDYISKPFNPFELNQKMNDLIPKRREANSKRVSNINYLKNAVGNETSAVKEILEIYLSKTPPILDAIDKEMDEEHYTNLQNLVHNLKNSVGIIGAEELFKLLDSLEQSLNVLPPTAETVNLIEKARKMTRESLKEIIEDYKTL